MEKTELAAVMTVEMGWRDDGSWAALWDMADHDGDGNRLIGDVLAEDVAECYLRSNGPILATVGLRDMIVVATADAILVAPKGKAQHVRTLVQRLKDMDHRDHMINIRMHRPWGWCQTTDMGDNFQVKRLCVKPGAKLSLRHHKHRAEHWVVIKGRARVICGDDCLTLEENESTFIPVGIDHRLENPGKTLLHVIEVQSGSYPDKEAMSDDDRA